MVFRLSLLLVLHILSAILMFFNFFGHMFSSIIALLGLVFPSLLVQTVQAAVSTFSRSALVPVRRGSVQPMELEWIWAICVILLGQKPTTSQDVRFKLFPTSPTWLFSPLTSVSPLWCSLTILKATWLLATVSYASARGVGRASAGIVGHVSRQLIMHIWSLGLIQVQTLRLDVLNRLGVAKSALHNHVNSQPFFGLRLGRITFFDPCVFQCLKLWTLALIHRLLDPDRRGGPCSDSPTEVRERDVGNQALFSEETTNFVDSLQGQKLGQPKGYKEGLFIAITMSPSGYGGSTSHSRRQTRTALYPSIPETPVPGFVVRITKYSAAKCGENEQLFCDRPFDHAPRLLVAILDKFTSFGTLDSDFHETKNGVQLYKLKVSNKDEQMLLPIAVLILQQIQDTPPSTPELECLQTASASTVLSMACFSGMNSLGIVYFGIKLGPPGNAQHVNFGLFTFNRDSVQKTRYPEFATQSSINEAYFSLLCTILKNRFDEEGSNAPKGEAYSYDIDNPWTTCNFHVQITGVLLGRPIHKLSGCSEVWC